jgi:spore coat polysaccharide biosynthesis protein SpsF (cytidylyltransferase family)
VKEANVVVAIPDTEENRVIREFIVQEGGTCFEWGGPEEDVLGRLFHCAHTFRWHPHTVILRVTPDDPEKDPQLMAQVAGGVRHPVELSCEALTLEQLGFLHYNVKDAEQREHLTLLYPVPPPEPPPGVWSIDTEEDYETVKARMEAA